MTARLIKAFNLQNRSIENKNYNLFQHVIINKNGRPQRPIRTFPADRHHFTMGYMVVTLVRENSAIGKETL